MFLRVVVFCLCYSQLRSSCVSLKVLTTCLCINCKYRRPFMQQSLCTDQLRQLAEIIMSSYIIAGSADNPDTAVCEEIANLIKSKYSNIDFRIVIKHASEWQGHINQICKTYGFRKKHNPIAYTFDGKIIGGKKDFEGLCQRYFGIDPKTPLKISQKINMESAQRELEAKLKLLNKKRTLQEKIVEAARVKLKGRHLKTVAGIFNSLVDEGVIYYVKYEERLAPSPSYKSTRQNQPVNHSVHESLIDIEQLTKKDQLIQVTQVVEQIEQLKNIKKMPTEQSVAENPEQKKEEEPEERKMDDQSIVQLQEVLGSAKGGSEKEKSVSQVEEGEATPQSSTFDLVNLSDLIVKPFKDQFYLAFHPQPYVDGQMILFRRSEADTTLFEVRQQSNVFIKDYSRYRRGRKVHFEKHEKRDQKQEISLIQPNQQEKKEEKKDTFAGGLLCHGDSHLSRPQISIRKILSELEWGKILKLLHKTDSIVTLQILPPQSKSHLQLSNGVINVYLRKFITQAHRSIGLARILDFLGKEGQLTDMQNYIKSLEPSKVQVAVEGGVAYSLPELPFQHLVVYQIDRSAKAYCTMFNAMCSYLADKHQSIDKHIGINLVVCNSYLLVTPIVDCLDQFNGEAVYLHESALLGLMSLPLYKTCWENRELNRVRLPHQCLRKYCAK